MSAYNLPLPDIRDPRTEEFWAATARGQLVLQRCDTCGYVRFPPTRRCPECLASGMSWTEVRPSGTLYSFARYQRALDRRFEGHLPYTVAYVELDDGPRMVGTLIGGAVEPAVGCRVAAVFDPVTPEVTLVRWALQAPGVKPGSERGSFT